MLYSRPCKKVIRAKIALHYPEAERETVWEKVQRQYAVFLSDWRTDLGGKKNFHNGVGGTYDCIAIMSYYTVCKAVSSFREIEEMEENLILPIFRRLRFVDCNKPFWRKLMYRTFARAKSDCDKWHDYEMSVAPYETDKPIYEESVMLLQVILEGIGLGVLLILVCAIGICKGAVGMVHLYSQEVQERCVTLGLTTHAKIKRNALIFKAVCVPGYIAYVLVCVYALNGARGFLAGFWQMLVILSVMNLMDRFLVDDFWVGHTKAWTIPGTEDLKPYITARDKAKKWLFGTVGMAVISAALAAIMMLFMKI